MADEDKPLHVSAIEKAAAEAAGVWKSGGPHERNRLRARIFASMHRMACDEVHGDDASVYREALEVRRLAVLLAQHIDENGSSVADVGDKDQHQRDEQGDVRKAWVAEYLAYISDSEGIDPPPDEMAEDIARHLKKMDIGANWSSEIIGDMVVKMAIMWSVGGNRREYALTGSTPGIRERGGVEKLDGIVGDVAAEFRSMLAARDERIRELETVLAEAHGVDRNPGSEESASIEAQDPQFAELRDAQGSVPYEPTEPDIPF